MTTVVELGLVQIWPTIGDNFEVVVSQWPTAGAPVIEATIGSGTDPGHIV